jgi:hypothetical protein
MMTREEFNARYQNLINKHMKVLRPPSIGGESEELSELIYFDIPAGWLSVVDRALTRLGNIEAGQTHVSQIKEKYGSLQIYDDGCCPQSDFITILAEAESMQTCQYCESAGTLQKSKGGWLATVCKEHTNIKGAIFDEFTTPSGLPPEPVIAIIDRKGMKAVVSIETGELLDISMEDKPTMSMPVFRADLNSGGGFSMNWLISDLSKAEEGGVDLLVRAFQEMFGKMQRLQK